MIRLKKELQNTPPRFLLSDYYISKFPLVYRINKMDAYNNLFSFIKNLYINACNLDVDFKTIIKSFWIKTSGLNNNNNNNIKFLSEKVINNTKHQNALKFYYNEFKKLSDEDFKNKVNYNFFYYQMLVSQLEKMDLIYKYNWRYILNVFNLRYHLKIKKDANGNLILNIDEELDELTKLIFLNIFKFKEFKNVEAVKFEKRDPNSARFKDPYFYRIERSKNGEIEFETAFNNAYFYTDYKNFLIEEEDSGDALNNG